MTCDVLRVTTHDMPTFSVAVSHELFRRIEEARAGSPRNQFVRHALEAFLYEAPSNTSQVDIITTTESDVPHLSDMFPAADEGSRPLEEPKQPSGLEQVACDCGHEADRHPYVDSYRAGCLECDCQQYKATS